MFGMQQRGQFDGTVDGDPAHRLEVEEVLRVAALEPHD
jgi:hypothetical protein